MSLPASRPIFAPARYEGDRGPCDGLITIDGDPARSHDGFD
jgi:hypothetical protein